MWGANIGTLKFYTLSTGPNSPFLTITGDHGNQWLKRTVSVNLGRNDEQVK
jgi:hypothetical protein